MTPDSLVRLPGPPVLVCPPDGPALRHASPPVRDALRRLPAPPGSGGELGAVINYLHVA